MTTQTQMKDRMMLITTYRNMYVTSDDKIISTDSLLLSTTTQRVQDYYGLSKVS